MNGIPTSLHDIRPAQAGIVLLGRPTCAHIAATLVDLALRDVLRVEQLSNGGSVDWLLTQHIQSTELAGYEKVLLRTLFSAGDRLWFAAFNRSRAAGMRQVGGALRRDAIRAGWLHRLWHKGEQTKQGERLRQEVQAFRRSLRDDGLPVETAVLRQLLPYTVAFGLLSRPDQVAPPYHKLAAFALAWTATCETVPGWRPSMGPVEPSSSFSEHYYPPPSAGGVDGTGL